MERGEVAGTGAGRGSSDVRAGSDGGVGVEVEASVVQGAWTSCVQVSNMSEQKR